MPAAAPAAGQRRRLSATATASTPAGWRMGAAGSVAARHLVAGGRESMAGIALKVGYGPASAVSAAFARHVGLPPARYAQQALMGQVLAG
ncbi:hypothetical protein GCM10007301_11800 [Azorhizobium oxalatiphilum]|uniref:HTH araC/xylS-type domain-containing protein n=1 Tax=Azorhizobium oxalatiphilum TaxID=980631 RepID=A0A917F7R6_9HYPH|nr:helix-turn-helix transcriptional regulator [Azorhizobium oxalatiphilum]GGF53953.1 hypothetical protein GCM10007301_11800 [Azorhizobium oxalatiphilum]